MGKPFSLDLRCRICAYISAGNSCRSAGKVFGVSASTAVRYGAERRERGRGRVVSDKCEPVSARRCRYALCRAKLTPLSQSGGSVQLEIAS
jgi:hypothetical protein